MSTLAEIIKERDFSWPDRKLLRTFYRGECSEVQPTIFPKPNWLTAKKHAMLMQYFAYVNLCRPAVNRIVSGVYGGAVNRIIADGSPHKDKVDRVISEANGYSLKCREWFKSAVMFGPGIHVFTIENDEVKVWRPNPLRTEIITHPSDVYELEWIVESTGSGDKEQFRFVSREGWGVADKDGHILTFTPHGLGIVPASICYGEDERTYGNVDGSGLVNSSVQYSIVVSRLLLNQVALMMNSVRPQAVVKGEVNNEDIDEAFEPDGVLEVSADGDFLFVTPQTNFKDLTATIDNYKANFCISDGIPLDALDPNNIPENQSATSARLRNQPLSVTINRLVQEQTTAEIRALTIIGALYEYIEVAKQQGEGAQIDFADFASRFHASVTMEPSGNPESYAEEVNAWKVLLDMQAKTPEDVVRHFNPNLSEAEIARRVKEIEAAAEEARQQFAQGDPANTTNDEPESDSADREDRAA